MSELPSDFFHADMEKLETLYHQARAEYKDYKLRDAAKFRALEQKAENYETFRNIVDAAHLQPVRKKEYTHLEDFGKESFVDRTWSPLDDEMKMCHRK